MSSGFITENEVAEYRRKKQEEWERVRKADDPVEAPEQPYDSRSLYERLQEQKQRKDLEYEEAHKLKNMIKGLDDDEIEFLDLVDRTKIAADRRKTLEEEKELSDYRSQVAHLQEKSLNEKLQAEILVNKPKTTIGSRTSQTKLLKGVIVTKSESLKRKANMETIDNTKIPKIEEEKKLNETTKQETSTKANMRNTGTFNGSTGLTCVGILPGLGHYEESSSDECSSDLDEDVTMQTVNTPKFDLIGRKIVPKAKETNILTGAGHEVKRCKVSF